ncbi:putative membrane protein [Streptomyces davaonensis JCM 4913]|uniref:Putative membrane protein n=1 Tax=Streptomyces davaonensis (strain DSM 101723 / JCM 4913 / KCC S-0913 / 768) TaxID=1214101 RepID=K4R637_STRDJ|nr:YoaK family protein [Streptomyces davaonensis]CCK28540.1 putative membrane protein [Streptomyces davaonensis JCM 4913]
MRRLLTDIVRTLIPTRDDPHGPLAPLMLTLTVVTGLVDAVSYLALGHVFVANMTGNVVFLGFALAGAADLSVLASVVALAAFLAGALAGGRLATRFATHRGKLLGAATAGQTVLVAVTVVAAAVSGGEVTTGVRYTLIVFLGLAMGLQNAVARRLGVPDLTTTVLTLTLTGLAADSTPGGGKAPRPGRRILSVLTMFVGAYGGAQLVLHDHLVLTLALILLLLALASTATHRLSSQDPPWTRSPS